MTETLLNTNPIPDLVQLGYTAREAAFLYLVGRASGFFLGRQYLRFLERKPGALVQQLIRKAMARRHIETLDYGQQRHLYHLKSRTLYRLLGDEDSQNRHAKGDQEIKTKLMILDYVLERRGERFLCSPQEKGQYFREFYPTLNPAQMAVASPPPELTSTTNGPLMRDRFPFFLGEGQTLQEVTPEFTYIDHGTRTLEHFRRHLRSSSPHWSRLARFQLVYVALSPANFRAAQHAFQQEFPAGEVIAKLMPGGKKHLIRYFEARELWDQNDPRFTPLELAILKEGEQLYWLLEHDILRKAWRRGGLDEELSRMCGETRTTATLVFHLLRETYPIFGYRYHGKAHRNEADPRLGRFSASGSMLS